jgi:hypothetical protein
LIPKLYEAFPNSTLDQLINTTISPEVSIGDNDIKVQGNLSLDFTVHGSGDSHDSSDVFAFSLWCPLGAAANIYIDNKGNVLAAKVDNITATFHTGESPYGGLIGVIDLIGPLLNRLINDLALPVVNKLLSNGIPIPDYHKTISDIGTVYASLINPKLQLYSGYVLIGSDFNLTFVPTAENISKASPQLMTLSTHTKHTH